MRSRIAIVLAACAGACAAVGIAWGQPGEPGTGSTTAAGSGSGEVVKDPRLARKWRAAAQELVARGDYDARVHKDAEAKEQYGNAITAYHKAIEAGDDPALYLALAAVEEKLDDNAAAYEDLTRLTDASAGVKPDVAKKAQARLDDLSTKIGIVRLAITPDGTSVAIDGKQAAEAPVTAPLVLDPGKYTLSFAAVGFQPKDQELTVEAGSEADLKIALEPIRVASKPIEVAPPPRPPRQPDRLPLYVGAGATGGLVVIATVTGIAAIAKHGTFTDPSTRPSARKDAQSSGRTLAHITDACLGGAIVAAAFTTYWYLYRYSPERRGEHEHAKLDVVPWVQPDTGGLFAAGTF